MVPSVKLEPPSARPSPAFESLQNVPPYKKPPEHKDVQRVDYKGMWPPSYSAPPKTKMGHHHHAEGKSLIHYHFVLWLFIKAVTSWQSEKRLRILSAGVN